MLLQCTHTSQQSLHLFLTLSLVTMFPFFHFSLSSNAAYGEIQTINLTYYNIITCYKYVIHNIVL